MPDLPPALLSPEATYEDCSLALEGARWELIAAGDWSWVYTDPSRRFVARFSPWDPAYEVFIELCRTLAGNPYAPEVFEEVHLADGGHLAVLERLEDAPRDQARQLMAALQGRHEVDEADLLAVIAEARRIDERARATVPFWRGIDDNPRNVMRDARRQLKVIDLFYVGGLDLHRAIRRDVGSVLAQLPPGSLWAFSDLPAFRRHAAGRDVLRRALLKAGPDPRARASS